MAGAWLRPDDRGQVVFVRHALPGERVRRWLLPRSPAKLARADAVEILDPSPDRVAPPCPHARPGGCGGCDWQHASPARPAPAQGRRHPPAASPGSPGWTARSPSRRCPATSRTPPPHPGSAGGPGSASPSAPTARAGLHQHRSHKIVHVGECPIAHAEVNDLGVTAETWPGAASVQAAAVPETGERGILVTAARRSQSRSRGLAHHARPRPGAPPRLGSLPPVTADSVATVAPSGARTSVAGRWATSPSRPPAWAWRVDLAGFWQVHPAAADTLAGRCPPGPGTPPRRRGARPVLRGRPVRRGPGPGGRPGGPGSSASRPTPPPSVTPGTTFAEWPWARVHRGDVAEVLGRIGLSGASLVVLDPPRAVLLPPSSTP